MRHALVRAVTVTVLVGSAALLATRDVGRDASPITAAQAATATELEAPLSAAARRDPAPARVEPGLNVVGGSSQISMIVTEAQRAEILRQVDLLGLANAAGADLRGIAIAIGSKLPRERIRLSPMPSQISRVVPKYGAYEYFLTSGGDVIIVDPSAYQIVDVVRT